MGILGYKPTDPEDPKTKRKTPKPRVGTKRENRSIVFSPHFTPLFLCDDETTSNRERERETGTIITVGTAAAAKKKKKSICFCGRKERRGTDRDCGREAVEGEAIRLFWHRSADFLATFYLHGIILNGKWTGRGHDISSA